MKYINETLQCCYVVILCLNSCLGLLTQKLWELFCLRMSEKMGVGLIFLSKSILKKKNSGQILFFHKVYNKMYLMTCKQNLPVTIKLLLHPMNPCTLGAGCRIWELTWLTQECEMMCANWCKHNINSLNIQLKHAFHPQTTFCASTVQTSFCLKLI